MDKNQVIQLLRTAKRDHLAWVGRAELLVQGIPVSKEQLPVLHTDCNFGRWYFGEGQVLAKFTDFRAIDPPHQTLHHAYAQIFKLLLEEENPSFFSKLLGTARKQHERNMPAIEANMHALEQASQEVVRHLEALEHILHDMPDEDVVELFR